MLTIRQAQQDALSECYRELFVDRMVGYFRSRWAEECDDLEDEELREMIRNSREKAEGYGITVEADVVIFSESWLILGDDFDEDPDYPWAPAILNDEQATGTARAAAVRHQTRKFLEELAGSKDML